MATAAKTLSKGRSTTKGKRSFDIDVVMQRIRETITSSRVADAAMFALASEGYTSLFEQLVACIISIRTYDEIMLTCARQLFARVRAPAAMGRLGRWAMAVGRWLIRSEALMGW